MSRLRLRIETKGIAGCEQGKCRRGILRKDFNVVGVENICHWVAIQPRGEQGADEVIAIENFQKRDFAQDFALRRNLEHQVVHKLGRHTGKR